MILNLIIFKISINILIMVRFSLYSYFRNKYPDDEKLDEEYCDELCYYPNTKEYLDFIDDFRTLLNNRKIRGWGGEERRICNIFNTPEDKNNKECQHSLDYNIFWIVHGLWETLLYPGEDCLPQQLLIDFKKILDNNNDIRSMRKLFDVYKKIKHIEFLETYRINKIIEGNKKLIEENKKLIEENIKLAETVDVRKKIQQWLENNSREVNFKNGKELYDIIN